MGSITISDGQGNCVWEGRNVLTESFQLSVLRGLIGHPSNIPRSCAVGVTYDEMNSPQAQDTPWNKRNLNSEISRRLISGSFINPITSSAHILIVFRSPDINTTWRELALFDSKEFSSYGDRVATSCDALNSGSTTRKWETGSGNTIFADPASAVEGVAALVTQGDTDLLFRNQGVALNGDGMTTRARLQFFLGVSNPTSLHSTNGVNVRAYTVYSGTYWEWTIDDSDLSAGYNFIDLTFDDASTQPSDSSLSIVALQIQAVGRSAGMSFNLDGIRLFEESGTMLARAEIHPPLTKFVGSTLVINWIIESFSEV